MSRRNAAGLVLLSVAALGLAVIAGIWLARGDPAWGSDPATISIGSDQGPHDSSLTVPLEILGAPAPGVSAATVDIAYDPAVLDPTAWQAGTGWDMVQCNLDYGPSTVRCTTLSTAGRSGDSQMASVTFHLIGGPGQCSALDVTVPTFADANGSPIPVTDDDGTACIEGGPGTPTPAPVFTVTPTPSVTPETLVSIGSGVRPPGTSGTLPLQVLNAPAPGVGAVTVDVAYDPTVVDPTGWDAGPGWDMVLCSLDYGPSTIRCTALSATGRSGDSLIAGITFQLLEGCTILDVTPVTFTDPGGNPIPVADQDGELSDGSCTTIVRIPYGHGTPGSLVTLPVEILNAPSPGVAAVTVDVTWPDIVDATTYEAGPGWDMVQCNLSYGLKTLRCTGLSTTGRAGDSVLVNLTFLLDGSPGECGTLDIAVPTFTDPTGSPIEKQIESPQICIDSGNAMAVDAKAGEDGTQEPDPSWTVSPIGATFDVDVLVTDAAVPYAAYQTVLQWDPSILGWVGHEYLEGPSDGEFDLCAPASAGPDNVKSACTLLGGTTEFTGRIDRITLECLQPGSSPLHLVTSEEAIIFTTTLGLGGAEIPTGLTDAVVECSDCIDREGDTQCDDPVNDPDDDGCTTDEEAALGSVFDPTDGWYDVCNMPHPAKSDADGANGARDGVIDIRDVLATAFYAFTEQTDVCGDNPNVNGVDYDCIKGWDGDGDSVNDADPVHDIPEGLKYDRTAGPGPDPQTGIYPCGPPDGAIDIRDVLAVIAQAFVVDCTGQ
jgi:hypothetical protein